MSPKASRSPGDEPAEPDLPPPGRVPPGHVPLSRPRRGPEPVSWWWKSAGLIVLLAAASVGIWLVVKGPDPRESARGTAGLVAESLTDGDMTEFKSYACDSDKVVVPDSLAQTGATTVLAVSSELNNVATATLAPSKRPELDLVVLLNGKAKDGQWCVVVVTPCPHYLDAPSASTMPDINGCRLRPRG